MPRHRVRAGRGPADTARPVRVPGHRAPLPARAAADRPVAQAVPFPEPRHDRRRPGASGSPRFPGGYGSGSWNCGTAARDHDGLARRGDRRTDRALRPADPGATRARATIPSRALRELLSPQRRGCSTRKLRRLEVLIARARAGTVLDGRHRLGDRATAGDRRTRPGCDPDDPVLRGPGRGPARPGPARAAPSRRRHGAGDGDATCGTRAATCSTAGPRDRHFVGELEDDGRLALRFGDGRHGAPSTARRRLDAPLPARRRPRRATSAPRPSTTSCSARDAERERTRRAGARRRRAQPAARRRRHRARTGRAGTPVGAAGSAARRGCARSPPRTTRPSRPAVPGRAARRRRDPLDRQRHRRPTSPSTRYGTARERRPVAARRRRARPGGVPQDRPRPRGPPGPTVPLDIELTVCAAPGHQHGQILARAAPRARHRHARRTGGLGFFHPDALTFGEPVRLSRLVAVAAAVPGVESVQVTRLRRLFHEDRGESWRTACCGSARWRSPRATTTRTGRRTAGCDIALGGAPMSAAPAGCGCTDGSRSAAAAARRPRRAPAPAALYNPPGRTALDYRVGDYGSFLAAMLDRLASPAYPALRGLTVRTPDDPAIALLDAWAVLGDLLTFHSERIADEGYLRTANEHRSLALLGAARRPPAAARRRRRHLSRVHPRPRPARRRGPRTWSSRAARAATACPRGRARRRRPSRQRRT